MTTPASENAAPRRARRRLPPPRKRPWRLLAGIVVAAAALLVGAWSVYRDYRRNHVTIVFEDARAPVPSLELTFYPDQLAFAAPSPPPPIGERLLAGQAVVVVGRELVPGHGLVRYRGEGVGAGFAFVELGKQLAPIELRPPHTLRGRVAEPFDFWFFGWRCAGHLPIARAEVVVMGGGEHGVDLASTRTDEQGVFELAGFDGDLDALGLRVRASGYGIVHHALDRSTKRPVQRDGDRGLIVLQPTLPRRGRIVSSVDLDLSTVRVLARGLPGVEAGPAPDGTFVLDHVPDDVEARIVLYGLPDTCAYKPVRTQKGQEVRIDVVPGAVVRGRVIDDTTWQPIAGALVWAGDQEAVRTDADGCYELLQVPPGSVDVMAQGQPRRRRAPAPRGARRIELLPGSHHDQVDIRLEQ